MSDKRPLYVYAVSNPKFRQNNYFKLGFTHDLDAYLATYNGYYPSNTRYEMCYFMVQEIRPCSEYTRNCLENSFKNYFSDSSLDTNNHHGWHQISYPNLKTKLERFSQEEPIIGFITNPLTIYSPPRRLPKLFSSL